MSATILPSTTLPNQTKTESATTTNTLGWSALKALLTRVRKESPILYTIGVLHLVVALMCIPGLLFDERMVLGISAWLKPFKFLVSGGIYILTFGAIIFAYPFSNRKAHIIRNLMSWTLLAETGIIVYQGVVGVQSHFNQSSLSDGILFGLMGLFIGVNVILMAFLLFEAVRLKLKCSGLLRLAIIFGWATILVGSWVGGQMISQLGHTVGAADGEAGIPFLNWSTIAGDLRIAHFFSIHALQLFPLAALLLTKKIKSVKAQYLFFMLLALAYAGFIAFVYLQAQQGISFFGSIAH